MRKLTHQELLARQKDLEVSSFRFPLVVVLNNIRSLYNVGSIFRTADAVGVEKIYLCGITGKPDGTRTGISKTALGAEEVVPWEHRWNARAVVGELKARGYEIILLEQVKEGIPFQDYEPKGPVCLVLGNEISGVARGLLPLSDQAIEIEMSGLKNSLNVTVAFGVVVYHIRNCMKCVVS